MTKDNDDPYENHDTSDFFEVGAVKSLHVLSIIVALLIIDKIFNIYIGKHTCWLQQ